MFKYDVLIDEEDICNYEEEIKRLDRYVNGGEKILTFAPRRFGKTSVLVNVTGKHFLARKKSAIFCYVNLQEVKDLDSIAIRFSHALTDVINKVFSIKVIASNILKLLKSLRPEIKVDSLSGETKLTISTETTDKRSLHDIFNSLLGLGSEYPLLLVMDEFQDVVFVPEAEALLRDLTQKLNKGSIIISGSKKHLLKDIFLDERRPFYNWGKSLELKEISFENWKPYILERMKNKKIRLDDDALRFIIQSGYHIPNYICKLCSDIYNSHEHEAVEISEIKNIIHHGYLDAQSRYAEKVAFLSIKQVKFLSVIAKNGYIKEVTSQATVSESGISARGMSQMCNLLMDKGYVEKDENGVRIADPFFAYYLSQEY